MAASTGSPDAASRPEVAKAVPAARSDTKRTTSSAAPARTRARSCLGIRTSDAGGYRTARTLDQRAAERSSVIVPHLPDFGHAHRVAGRLHHAIRRSQSVFARARRSITGSPGHV